MKNRRTVIVQGMFKDAKDMLNHYKDHLVKECRECVWYSCVVVNQEKEWGRS